MTFKNALYVVYVGNNLSELFEASGAAVKVIPYPAISSKSIFRKLSAGLAYGTLALRHGGVWVIPMWSVESNKNLEKHLSRLEQTLKPTTSKKHVKVH